MAKKKPYRYPLYLLFRGAAGLVYLLPRSIALALGRGLGRLTYVFVSRQRERTLTHLRNAFGGAKSETEIRSIARQVFENLAMTAVEVLQFPKMTEEKALKIIDCGDAFKVYDEILAEGKGLISITAHMGNWELLAGLFGLKGYQGGVLARRIYYEPYNNWIVGLRNSVKVPTIYRDRSGRRILELLSGNQIVGMLPDQDIDSLKGIFVNFFGRSAYTPVAPAKIALTSGAPIVPNFLLHQPGGRYRLVIGDVIRVHAQGNRDDAIREGTERWMKSFEQVIRKYPEQWGWMHDRWKTRKENNCGSKSTQPSTMSAEVAS